MSLGPTASSHQPSPAGSGGHQPSPAGSGGHQPSPAGSGGHQPSLGSASRWEWTLPAAAALAALESTVLISIIAVGSYPAGPLLMAILAVKLVFCWGLLHRRPGAWMALMLWEASGAVAAVARPGLPLIERLVELTVCLACMALLGTATVLFPTPRMPSG